MIEKLVEIGVKKQGNKRKLGIYLGFQEKYASQRINNMLANPNVKMEIFEKLLAAADLDTHVELAIAAEYKKTIKD